MSNPEDMKNLTPHVAECVDNIDAAFFVGDSLNNEEALNDIEFFVDRWKREIISNRKLLKEHPVEDEEE